MSISSLLQHSSTYFQKRNLHSGSLLSEKQSLLHVDVKRPRGDRQTVKMRCIAALLKILILFIIASFADSIIGFQFPQKILEQPNNGAATKLRTLQTFVGERIAKHKSVMAKHHQVVSSTLQDTASSFDESSLILSDFKYEMANLKEAGMPEFLDELFNFLKTNGGELKQEVTNALSGINQRLVLMTKELDEMDVFLSQALVEMTLLEQKILTGTDPSRKTPQAKNWKTKSYLGKFTASSPEEEEEILQACTFRSTFQIPDIRLVRSTSSETSTKHQLINSSLQTPHRNLPRHPSSLFQPPRRPSRQCHHPCSLQTALQHHASV